MAAGLTLEQLEFLAGKGLSLGEAIEFAKLGKKQSAGAERTARWRAKKKVGNVTSDVTRDASPPPIDNHTPPVSSDEETRPARKTKTGKAGTVAKPEGVRDAVWRDFSRQRKTPVTETALAGIEDEARLAGWSLDRALAEAVSRGWQSFKADWVAARGPPPDEPISLVDQILARKAAVQ